MVPQQLKLMSGSQAAASEGQASTEAARQQLAAQEAAAAELQASLESTQAALEQARAAADTASADATRRQHALEALQVRPSDICFWFLHSEPSCAYLLMNAAAVS